MSDLNVSATVLGFDNTEQAKLTLQADISRKPSERGLYVSLAEQDYSTYVAGFLSEEAARALAKALADHYGLTTTAEPAKLERGSTAIVKRDGAYSATDPTYRSDLRAGQRVEVRYGPDSDGDYYVQAEDGYETYVAADALRAETAEDAAPALQVGDRVKIAAEPFYRIGRAHHSAHLGGATLGVIERDRDRDGDFGVKLLNGSRALRWERIAPECLTKVEPLVPRVGDLVKLVDRQGIAAEIGATALVTGDPRDNAWGDETYLDVAWVRDGKDRGQADGGYEPKHFEVISRES